VARWFTRSVLAVVMVVAMVALTAHPTRVSADERDFTLINGSASVTITHVYVTPTEAQDWGDDILGRDVLLPGESVFIYFTRFDPGFCLYDIQVIGQGGEQGFLYKVDLCSTDTVTFS
jgi:hypothetical protein